MVLTLFTIGPCFWIVVLLPRTDADTVTTYSVLFKFCFFGKSIIIPAKYEVCTDLPKKLFEMATQPF